MYLRISIKNYKGNTNKSQFTKAMAQQPSQLVKINLEHNLSSLKIPELKVDPHMTILALK